MGTVPLVENLRIPCADGSVVRIEADTSTSDLMDGEHGVAGIYGSLPDGRDFGFSISLSKYSETWQNRFCDAVAAHPEFRDRLPDVEDGDALTIPAAPARDGGKLSGLLRKGKDAKFKDFVGLRSGRDRFPSMRLPDLEAQAGERACAELDGRMDHVPEADRPVERAKVLRWHLRGLPVAMAVRKVDVDREVTANVIGGRRG